jgi:beta-lactamase class C
MRRITTVLIAAGVLGAAAWFGLSGAQVDSPAAMIRAISGKKTTDIPDTPDEWKGRIDYVDLDGRFSEMASRPEMAGLAVAIVENGELRFVGTYGVLDRTDGSPVTPASIFRWASVSKTVTGALAATLASEAAVDLEEPLSSWNSSLRLPGGAETQITLAQLLSQQTGLTKNAYDEKLEEGENPADLRTRLVSAPLQCLPGTCHTYQNIAFDDASEILAQAADRPFAAAVSERLFLPLGMTSATYGMAGLTGAKQWARPHNGPQVRTLREAYWRVPAAAGVNSNIVDFARWMQAMMGEQTKILPESTLRITHMPRVATQSLYGGELRRANSDASYGLGWRNFTYDGHRLAGHSGAVDGYRATMIFEPSTRTGVVVMWNSNWGRPFRIPFAVMDSYYGKSDSQWMDFSDLLPLASAPDAAQ